MSNKTAGPATTARGRLGLLRSVLLCRLTPYVAPPFVYRASQSHPFGLALRLLSHLASPSRTTMVPARTRYASMTLATLPRSHRLRALEEFCPQALVAFQHSGRDLAVIKLCRGFGIHWRNMTSAKGSIHRYRSAYCSFRCLRGGGGSYHPASS